MDYITTTGSQHGGNAIPHGYYEKNMRPAEINLFFFFYSNHAPTYVQNLNYDSTGVDPMSQNKK